MGIPQVKSYEVMSHDDGTRLRLWTSEDEPPEEFLLSELKVTQLRIEFEREELHHVG